MGAPFDVDTAKIKRTPPVSCADQWPPRTSCGADNAIRPLDGSQKQSTALGGSPPGKLPKLKDGKGKDFPKGKVLKTASQPDLRALRPRPNTSDAVSMRSLRVRSAQGLEVRTAGWRRKNTSEEN